MDKQVFEAPGAGPQIPISRAPRQRPVEGDKTRCRVCASPIEPSAKKCKECKAYQEGDDCLSCGYAMASDATRCPECNSYQDWRRFLPDSQMLLAGAVALLSLLTPFLPLIHNLWRSNTTLVRVLG